MKIDDLTSVFERPDVREAFAGHCCRTHDPDDYQQCQYCALLRAIVANAIVEAAATDFAVAPEFSIGDAADRTTKESL